MELIPILGALRYIVNTVKLERSRLGCGCLCITGLLLLAVVIVVIRARMDSQRGLSVSRLESLIQAEVPPNADRKSVEQWFDAHEIDHVYVPALVNMLGQGDMIGHKTIVEVAGFQNAGVAGYVRGMIEGERANVGFMENGRISTYFFLDKDGKVIGHYVDQFIYSL